MDAPLVEVDDGWDFKVLILEDEWVVRWPRHGLAVDELEKEVDLLPALAPLLPVEVPRFEYVSREPWLVAYRFIRGQPLTDEDTRAVVKVPSAPMPRLERPTAGALSSTPPCMSIPFGAPLALSK